MILTVSPFWLDSRMCHEIAAERLDVDYSARAASSRLMTRLSFQLEARLFTK